MPAYALDAWIAPLEASVEERRLRLLCPTAFHRDRVRERFAAPIARCAELEAGRPVDVELALRPAGAGARAAEPPAARPPAPVRRAAPRGRGERPTGQRALPYRFENFVVGPCNALAREASLALARGGQRGLDRLFLVSAHGNGKTHLARAIVDEARQAARGRVLYASAESFTNEFMASIRSRHMAGFKRRWREGCDVVVVEDVQFLRGKPATQLELFHTVTHLVDAGARVVFTGDRLPRDIDGLDLRLRSQLDAGLVAELELPDARVRREILRSKAAAGGVRLPDDCLQLLVTSIRGSVRDLEAALIQLVASASLLKRPIDVELTRTALAKVAPLPPRRRLGPLDVIAVVAAFFRTPGEALASRSRRRDVLVPRQLAMYLCRRYTDASLAEIGRAFGRDHPAVANAVRVVERAILERAPLRYQVEALCERIESLAEDDPPKRRRLQ